MVGRSDGAAHLDRIDRPGLYRRAQLRVGASRMRFRIAAVPPMSRHPLPSHEAAE
jgi:hypothetical protein